MNDDLRDKSSDVVPKKRNDNSILEHLDEVKKKKKNNFYAFKGDKHGKRFVKLRRFKASILQIQQ